MNNECSALTPQNAPSAKIEGFPWRSVPGDDLPPDNTPVLVAIVEDDCDTEEFAPKVVYAIAEYNPVLERLRNESDRFKYGAEYVQYVAEGRWYSVPHVGYFDSGFVEPFAWMPLPPLPDAMVAAAFDRCRQAWYG